MSDLNERIHQMSDQLSPAERRASQQLMDSYEELPFLTADAISRQGNISASTVVRLVSKLGYGSYMELQSEAQERLKQRLSSFERLRKVGKGSDLQGVIGEKPLSPSLEQDIRQLVQFAETVSIDEIKKAADSVVKAENILVVGYRASAPLTYYLYLGLTTLLGPRVIIGSDAMLLPELVASLTEKDLLIAISFPRYSSVTIDAAEAAQNKRKSKVVAITNSILSPLAPLSEIVLTCPFSSRAYQNSPIASYALTHILIEQVVEILRAQRPSDTEKRIIGGEQLLAQWRWLREIEAPENG